jgi:hypothetical protein
LNKEKKGKEKEEFLNDSSENNGEEIEEFLDDEFEDDDVPEKD